MSKLVLRNVAKRYGSFDAVSDFSLELAPGRIRLAARSLRLRQDYDPAHDRGLHDANRGTIEMDGGLLSSPARSWRRRNAACR